MNLDLTGKNALICGSTQGIGYAIAWELAALGATCFLLARNEARLIEAAASLPTPAQQIHRIRVADFAFPNEVQQVVQQLAAENTMHVLINNTGGPAGGPILDAHADAFMQTFQQHLINNHQIAQALVPGMKAAGYGRIINVISTSVKIPLANLGVSNTIRGAVASWSKTLANELGVFGITVNNVLPGATETVRLQTIIQQNASKKEKDPDEISAEMMREIPARRFGAPAEIAAVAAFLASPAAAYVNGVSIPVDGGRTGSL
jgi:3-oxoacyl-[acyl-carrier protein] reductase